MENRFLWTDLVIPSTLNLSSYLDILLDNIPPGEMIDKLELGLHEALVNAVQHGNYGDPKKNIRVRRIITPNWYIWQIQDEGQGLPIHKRSSCLPSKVDAVDGRGLFLIHHCFDDIRWSRKGNRIQLASRRL